jgi:hypothetical protein
VGGFEGEGEGREAGEEGEGEGQGGRVDFARTAVLRRQIVRASRLLLPLVFHLGSEECPMGRRTISLGRWSAVFTSRTQRCGEEQAQGREEAMDLDIRIASDLYDSLG